MCDKTVHYRSCQWERRGDQEEARDLVGYGGLEEAPGASYMPERLIFRKIRHAVGKGMEDSRQTKNGSLPTHHQSTKDTEGLQSSVIHDITANTGHANSKVREKDSEENNILKSTLLTRGLHKKMSVQNADSPAVVTHRGSKKTNSQHLFGESMADGPEKKYAKMFWDYFVHELNAVPEGFDDSVKTLGKHWESCKTLPFSQHIVHEDCEKVVIQNNLCFGKCNSLYVPNQSKPLNMCSYCQPFKFTKHHLKLNCKGSKKVVKAVMMVEECKCMENSKFHQQHDDQRMKLFNNSNNAI
ncbi:cerberus [Hyperolius riggenbachi]|uniref:cerberus n=1 Tax=Hyperolius riggenbachi TaxID=752182 RepID=UPI0035A29335